MNATLDHPVLPDPVTAVLPTGIAAEIARTVKTRPELARLSEIRLRVGGVCTLTAGGENLPLFTRVDAAACEETVKRISGGSLYAFRDTLSAGYLPMAGGVRVGVCGEARYEGGKLVGISAVTSLVFRLPRPYADTAEEIARIFRSGVRRGLLVFAPPGGGKTTALRALARLLGTGREAMRVAVIDERCEFLPEDYRGATVDLLRGYRRGVGIEIATRTLSPEVILTDELGDEAEAKSVLSASLAGVPLIATAHGRSAEEVRRRQTLSPLFAAGLFDKTVGIFPEEGFAVREEEAET